MTFFMIMKRKKSHNNNINIEDQRDLYRIPRVLLSLEVFYIALKPIKQCLKPSYNAQSLTHKLLPSNNPNLRRAISTEVTIQIDTSFNQSDHSIKFITTRT